jgi:hypothetical protein
MVINSATSSQADVALWRPLPSAADAADAAGGSSSPAGASWLPWVLQVRSNPSSGAVDVVTADSRQALEAQTAGGEEDGVERCVVLNQPLLPPCWLCTHSLAPFTH